MTTPHGEWFLCWQVVLSNTTCYTVSKDKLLGSGKGLRKKLMETRNPTTWQSGGIAYEVLRAEATSNDGIYEVFANQGIGSAPDYHEVIEATSIHEAITFIMRWDNQMYDELVAD